MKLTLRLFLFAAAGIALSLLAPFLYGWDWDWSAHRLGGNIAFHVGHALPHTIVALLLGYVTRRRGPKAPKSASGMPEALDSDQPAR